MNYNVFIRMRPRLRKRVEKQRPSYYDECLMSGNKGPFIKRRPLVYSFNAHIIMSGSLCLYDVNESFFSVFSKEANDETRYSVVFVMIERMNRWVVVFL